jgi:hypothetical protein
MTMRKTMLAFAVLSLFLLGGGRAFSWENEQQPPKDFVTGGGFIFCTPSGASGNFGVGGGVKNGAFWGHLNYLDHGIGLHVKGTSVTNYLFVDTNTRDICGRADTNFGTSVCYRVRVTDNGEPGKNDIFGIRLTDCNDHELYRAGTCDLGASGSGTPAGGNIQLHKGNKSNYGPASGTCGA